MQENIHNLHFSNYMFCVERFQKEKKMYVCFNTSDDTSNKVKEEMYVKHILYSMMKFHKYLNNFLLITLTVNQFI